MTTGGTGPRLAVRARRLEVSPTVAMAATKAVAPAKRFLEKPLNLVILHPLLFEMKKLEAEYRTDKRAMGELFFNVLLGGVPGESTVRT